MNNIKKYIPNTLSILRIIVTPLVFIFGINKNYIGLIVIAILISITDYFDGFFARKWHVESEFGAKLDSIGDKALGISLLSMLMTTTYGHLLKYSLILEILISITSIIFFMKNKIANSILIGKLKTWFLFITLGITSLSVFYSMFGKAAIILSLITIVLEIMTLIGYILFGLRLDPTKIPEEEYDLFYELIEPIITTDEYQKRKNYPHHINESAYEHMLKVAYDCFKIGKMFHLDYKTLTVAGILHDFYPDIWQGNKEKKPLFERHGFTHAKTAVENSWKFYPNLMNEKLEGIMITHMFPLNIKPPTSQEGWMLTIIDKIDSFGFIMHPFALYKIMTNKDYLKERESILSKVKKRVAKRLKILNK